MLANLETAMRLTGLLPRTRRAMLCMLLAGAALIGTAPGSAWFSIRLNQVTRARESAGL